MAKYKAYPEYKESGVEWLGEIPTSWKLKKISWFFNAKKGSYGHILTKEYCEKNIGAYPVFSGQTQNNGVMGSIDSYEFDVGDEGVLFSTTVGAKAMSLNFITNKFSLSQNCMIIKRVHNDIYSRFGYYHFQPLFSYERNLIPEHMQASFRVEDLYSYRFALPSLEEQKKIANFLDHEIAKIDTLIEKQEKLIELLQEKRQAVISHAVTKGLDSLVAMKDSGVEWLGEVPEHWKIVPLKHCLNLVTERATDNANPIALENIEGWTGKFISTDTEFEGTGIAFNEGDILFGKLRPYLAKVYLTTKNGTAIGDFHIMRPSSDLDKRYAMYQLLQNSFISIVDGATHGAKMPRVGWDFMGNIPFIVPNLQTQLDIVDYLDTAISKIDKGVQKSLIQIDLLKERRTALISAAVTGKIDVRDVEIA